MSFQAGDEVVAEGEGAGRFFLILDGTAEVSGTWSAPDEMVPATPWARCAAGRRNPDRDRVGER